MDSMLQIKAVNSGLDIKSFILLSYIKDNFFLERIAGIKLQLSNPLIFQSSADVGSAFDKLVEDGFVSGIYNKGIISELELNKDSFKEFFTSKDLIIKREKSLKTKKKEDTGLESEIVKYYNTFPELPRPSGLTQTNKVIIKSKLELFSIEEIKDAIEFANKVTWIKSKLDESWLNLTWIIRNIDKFMKDGQYRTSFERKTTDYTKQDMDDIVVF